MTQPKALRLADRLEGRWALHPEMQEAAAELRRLYTDAEESEALRERLSALLRNTAIALRGPEPELTRWSWHDLPDLAAALKAELHRLSAVEAQRDALLEALKQSLEEAIYPSKMLSDVYEKARAAIKAVEEGK